MASTSTALGSDFFFGWDLLYKTIESSVNKKGDILIALAHFLLIKHNNFRCIGVGEDKTLSNDEVGSELLPDGWNDDDINYALRYVHDNQLYLLLGHKSEDCLIINLLDVKTKKVSNIGLEPQILVVKTKGRIEEILPSASALVQRYRNELLNPVFTGTTREVTTQTTTSNITPDINRVDPLRIGEPMRPRGQFVPPGMDPRGAFPDVGRGDLDPLGRGGPGNLFPFPSHPDIIGNARPRFDPFGPPDRNVRPNPNPDHFQPPNFGGHDFYM